MVNLDFTELDKWMTDLNKLQLDLHQVSACNNKNNRNNVNNTNNNSYSNDKHVNQCKHSTELSLDGIQQSTRILNKQNDNIQRNSYVTKSKQQQQQFHNDDYLSKSQRTTNSSVTYLSSIPTSSLASKYEYGIQSNKNNQNYYSIVCNNNESCIGQNNLENSITDSINTNHYNHGQIHYTHKADYQTRNTSVKEHKSVHWSKDLDASDSNRKESICDVTNVNNSKKCLTTNSDSSVSTTTTITLANAVTSNTGNNYGVGYINPRRQQLPERDASKHIVENYPLGTKTVDEFLRKRSVTSTPANSSNQMIRSQSLYTYLSMRNELPNKVATTSSTASKNMITSSKLNNTFVASTQPKLPPRQFTVNTTTSTMITTTNSSNHRRSDKCSEYSIPRRSICSSIVYGVDNSSTSSHLPSNRRSISPSLQKSLNRSVTDKDVDKNQSSKTNLTLEIFLPNRTSTFIPVNNTTTTLQALQRITSITQRLLTTGHALVERIPTLKLERCLEDDEYLLNYLLSWKMVNENLIYFEERQDMYGLFESPSSWLGEHQSTFNLNSNKNVFNRNETICVPDHTDQLFLRIGQMRWKRRYCQLDSSGFYFSKQKTFNKSSVTRLNIFQPNLYLYVTMENQNKTEFPTPFGLVVRPHSTQQTDSRLIIEMCALNEESWKTWYSLLRVAMIGKRLYNNYIVRTDTVKEHLENNLHLNYSLRNSSCFNSLNDRPFSSTLSNSDNDHLLNDLHLLNSNSKANSHQIEFSTKSSSYSVNDLTKPLQFANYINETNQKSNESTSLTSLTLYPIQSTSQKTSTHQSRLDKCNVKSVKKRIFGNGPSARRCTRSISQISSPFNVSLPYWIRASYEDKVNETFNETVL
ncbi:Growth factor receptor bound protein [Schistosoma japonicum]|nr:Growth factor receptor bound protein [Schistosoma japonicum]